MENPIFPGHLDDLKNIDVKVGYQHYRERGMLDKKHL